MTIQSENPLPRYATGQKSVTDGQRQNNTPHPQNILAGDNIYLVWSITSLVYHKKKFQCLNKRNLVFNIMTSCEKESYKTETHLFFTVDMLEDAEVTYGMTTTFSRSGNPEIHGSK